MIKALENKKNTNSIGNADDEKKLEEFKKKKKKERLMLLAKIIGFIVAVAILFGVIFGIHIVKGNEMSPAFKDGDLLLYFRLDKNCAQNDVVVFKKADHDQQEIKRVIGKANDVIDMTEDGVLMINNASAIEELHDKTYKTNSKTVFPHSVNPDSYFVLGDARENSEDSRDYGDVNSSEIKGKVIMLLLRVRGL